MILSRQTGRKSGNRYEPTAVYVDTRAAKCSRQLCARTDGTK